MLDDLLAGRRRLAIFTEPVPDDAFLPYVDCGALLQVEAAFVERPVDPANLAYTLYARADAVDPVLALIAAKCGLHRGTPVGDQERVMLATALRSDYSEVERFLTLPPIGCRTRPDLTRPMRLAKVDRIRQTLEKTAEKRGWRIPVVEPQDALGSAEIEEMERKELELMLFRSKPVSMFGDSPPETTFQPHVDRGAILRLEIAIREEPVGILNIPDTYYAMPGEADRLRRLVLAKQQVFRGERPADSDYDREVGRALGYNESEIDRFVADEPECREELRRVLMEKFGFDVNDPQTVRRRLRARTRRLRENGSDGER